MGIFDMEYTPNYQLPVWAENDRILRTDFNNAFSTIDQVLGLVPGKGNCQLWTTTYRGTGALGNNHQNYLTFPAPPLLVCIFGGAGQVMFLGRNVFGGYAIHSEIIRNQVYWEENRVRWSISDLTDDANSQMNAIGTTYFVLALLANS